MTNLEATHTATATALLETLREATNVPDLEYATPPVPLTGGFYAEMSRFRLAGAPAGLDGDLVARVVPNPSMGASEAAVQGEVARQGFPTPAVRLTAPDTSPLGRYLIVMDLVDGSPPMAGLSITTIAGQIPNLVRRLPDQLAGMAARLHALDPEPLAEQLERLPGGLPTTTAGFIEQQIGHATALDRADIARAGQRLIDTEPASSRRVITHGDLHPFNLLITADGPVLIDWTVAQIAHPAFTIAFTELMLANPPIPLPKVGTAALRPVARNIARRFLKSYRDRATPAGYVDEANLDWHRKVHALRILVELAGWDAAGSRPTRGHPWLILEPVALDALDLHG